MTEHTENAGYIQAWEESLQSPGISGESAFLPRRQQEKIGEFVSAFINQYNQNRRHSQLAFEGLYSKRSKLCRKLL